MTNGTGLMGSSSSTQSAIIVPFPGNNDSFIIFTVDDCQHLLANGLRYSIVKMSLSGGLGAVTSVKNVLLSPTGIKMAEKITAVKHCNNRDIWVITHGYGSVNGGKFYAWLITSTGIISTPVISTTGTVHKGSNVPFVGAGLGNSRGYMKASPNGKHIACAIPFDGAPDNQDPEYSSNGSFELFSFNNSTGIVSNPIKFGPYPDYKGAYGIEFSPGGKFLYGSTFGFYNSLNQVFQWNLKAKSISAIKSSAYVISTPSNNPGAIQIGSDDKLYVVKDMTSNGYLDCINNPESPAFYCNYQNNAIFLGAARYGRIGLPDFIQSFFDIGFSYSNNFMLLPTAFLISDSSNTDSVLWNFGDSGSGLNNQSKKYNPHHIYADTGWYHVKLITYHCGVTDTFQQRIYIFAKPHADFSINDSTQCFRGNQVIFSNFSTIFTGTISNYLWSFGDMTTSTAINPSHVYVSPGSYSVWLVAISDAGFRDSILYHVYIYQMPSVGFSINQDSQCLNTEHFVFTNKTSIGYGTYNSLWTFGNGDSSILKNTVHSYHFTGTYKVKLLITTNYGCIDSVSKLVSVNYSPKAFFTCNDSSQCIGKNKFFFNNQSVIPSGTLSYKWYFGDNDSSALINTDHKYLSDDTFNVSLIAVSGCKCTDTFNLMVIVRPSPKPSFIINDSTQCMISNKFVFTNNSTIHYGKCSYLWNFGDNDTTTTKNAIHLYRNPGIFKVNIRAVSEFGCTDSIDKKTFIYPDPEASFIVNDSTQCLNNNHYIFSNSSNIPNGNLTCYWNFGDKTYSTQLNPDHFYLLDSVFNVKLNVTSDFGCQDSATKNIIVWPVPVVNFKMSDSLQCDTGKKIVFSSTFRL